MVLDIFICMLIISLLQTLTPYWWWIIIVPFIYGLIKIQSASKGLLVSIISSGLSWLFYCLYYLLFGNNNIIKKVAIMMKLNTPLLIIIIIALITILATGIAEYCGYCMRNLFKKTSIM